MSAADLLLNSAKIAPCDTIAGGFLFECLKQTVFNTREADNELPMQELETSVKN
jgi:hypothetical protein